MWFMVHLQYLINYGIVGHNFQLVFGMYSHYVRGVRLWSKLHILYLYNVLFFVHL